MSKTLVKDKEYPNGMKLTAYIIPSDTPSTTTINDKIEGFCQFTNSDGSQVQGVMENNKLNGIGFTKHKDGQEYVGMYKDNIRHGMGCIYLGDRMFTGKFDNGEIQGFGEVEMLANDPAAIDLGADHGKVTEVNKKLAPDEIPKVFLRGQFKDLKLNGYGEIVNQKNNVIVKGEFKDDKLNGYGLLTVNGQNYIGNFKDGKKDGEGAEIDKNGFGYMGDYKEGKREGWGTLSYNEGQYTGQFQNGEKNGLAEIFDDDGCYQGEIKDGKPHGFGVYNGNEYQYTGEYKDGVFHGMGMYQSQKMQYIGGYNAG